MEFFNHNLYLTPEMIKQDTEGPDFQRVEEGEAKQKPPLHSSSWDPTHTQPSSLLPLGLWKQF